MTATKAEREHMGAVAACGCMLCRHKDWGRTPAQVHHPREGTGLGRRASHFDTIPLCPEHHTGKTGIHGMGRKAFEKHHGITEQQLLDMTRQVLAEEKARR